MNFIIDISKYVLGNLQIEEEIRLIKEEIMMEAIKYNEKLKSLL